MSPDLANTEPLVLIVAAVVLWTIHFIQRWKESRWTR